VKASYRVQDAITVSRCVARRRHQRRTLSSWKRGVGGKRDGNCENGSRVSSGRVRRRTSPPRPARRDPSSPRSRGHCSPPLDGRPDVRRRTEYRLGDVCRIVVFKHARIYATKQHEECANQLSQLSFLGCCGRRRRTTDIRRACTSHDAVCSPKSGEKAVSSAVNGSES